jgi:ArsR family transcriptional regulator
LSERSQKKTTCDDREKMTWGEQAKLLRSTAHPVRLTILEALSEGPKCVKDLNGLVNIVQPNLSQHIAALRQTKLIDSHACGALRCYYILRPTLVKKLIRLLRQEHPLCFRGQSSVIDAAKRLKQEVQKKNEK